MSPGSRIVARGPARPGEAEDVLRLSHRLVALHAGGIVLLIAVVLSTALWLSAQHNRLALQSSYRLVENEIGALRTSANTLIKDYSVWDQGFDAVLSEDREWIYSSIGSSVTELGTFDLALVSVPGRIPAFGWVAGTPPHGRTGILPAPVLEAIDLLLDPWDVRSSATLIAEFDGSPWIFAVSRMTPVSGLPKGMPVEELPQQIHGYRLTQEKLSRIGTDILTGGLSLSPSVGPGQAAIPIADYAGRTISHVVWETPRPGASILRKAAIPLTLALGMATAISAVSSLYAVRSARRLERALAAAKAADRSRTEFLSNVSHELRTPMNGVLGATQLLETTELTPEQREFVDLLLSSANAQMSLISDLIDLSRIDSGKLRLDPAPFAPLVVLNEVADMMRVAAAKKGVRLETDWGAPDELSVRGDAQAFRQVLTNLVGNAVKFTDHGSVLVRATAATQAGRVTITVGVVDTGFGIPEASLPRIFERFYQVDGSMSRLAEGTGLGLAISQKLAQSMGGDIVVTSALGAGSTFTFTACFDPDPKPAEARDAA